MNKNANSCFGDNVQLGVTVAVGAVLHGPLRSWPEVCMGTAMKIWGKGVYREKEKLCRPNVRCSWSVAKNKNKRRVDGLEAGD